MVAVALAGCATPQPSAPLPPGSSVPAVAERSPAPAPDEKASAPQPISTPRAVGVPVLPSEPTAALPAVELTPQILFQLLAADLAAQRGEVGAAWSTYHSAARQTRDPRLAKRATEIALGSRALNEATQSARLWYELQPDSPNATQTLEILLVAASRWDELEPVLMAHLARARSAGTLADAYPSIARALSRSTDRATAWAVMQRISASDLNVLQARITRASLAAAARDRPAALAEARAAIALAPDDEDAHVGGARLMADSPEGLREGTALLKGYLGRHPDAFEARTTYARLLLAQGESSAARDQFETALNLKPDNAALLLGLGQLALQSRDPSLARTYLERVLALPSAARRERDQAVILMAQSFEAEGKPQQALEWLEKVQPGEDRMQAVGRRAALLAKTGRLEEARAVLRNETVSGTPERVQLITAEAALLRDAGRRQEAFELLTRSLEQYPDQQALLYEHGMAAEQINRMDLMEQSMRRLIALNPENAHAYNALGYSLADRNLRLDEARALIERALVLAPNDPHIIDSLGWVLYRQKDNAGAARELARAYALSPEADIAVHLGEVMWVTGRQDEARRLWRAARDKDPGNTVLKDTLSRFNVSL